MKFLIKPFLSLFIAMMFLSTNAQDIHYSQFYLAPTQLNPALTGVMNCNVRFAANYRNQWASVLKANAFNTYSAAYDQKFAVGRSDYFGAGLNVWRDEAGSLEWNTTSVKLSGAYSKQMGGYRSRSHYLVIGAEVGGSQRGINFLKARWGEQHDGDGGFNPALPTGEEFSGLDNDQYFFLDVGAGLLWFTVLDKNNSFYAGAAFSHLNRANQSFFQDEFNGLESKFTFHAGGDFLLGERIGVVPGVVSFFQGPNFELNAGTSVKFLLGQTRNLYQAFQVGTWLRMSNHFSESTTMDALILSTKFEYENIGLGFSYDVNISDLKVASNGNGAFEFALNYFICNQTRRGVYCPRF